MNILTYVKYEICALQASFDPSHDISEMSDTCKRNIKTHTKTFYTARTLLAYYLKILLNCSHGGGGPLVALISNT